MNTHIPKLQRWLALDIDETLSGTVWYMVKDMQKLFWNPENLSAPKIVEKYRYAQKVPYWQSEKITNWIEKKICSNAMQTKLPVIPWAKAFVAKIHKIIPIAAYITVRPLKVLEGTKKRLKDNGFPSAPIIMKPDAIPREQWNTRKAEVLQTLYPQIQGIIDDNDGLLKELKKNYMWTVFVYDHDKLTKGHTYKNAFACKTWKDVYQKVKEVCFKK